MLFPLNRNNLILNILTHPFFVGAILTAGLYFTIGLKIDKYHVKHIEDLDSRFSQYYFYDLDGDDISEKIRIDRQDTLQTKVLVYKGKQIMDQINLHHRVADGNYLMFFDYDRDSIMEFAVFTQYEDSIFLNILNPFLQNSVIRANRFIDIKGKSAYSSDNPHLTMIDSWGEENQDLFFIINSGYSLYPRNLYRYSVDKDSLVKSPDSGSPVTRFGLTDLDGDSIEEIIIPGMATGNLPGNYPFSDQYLWLMVYDRDLNFFFPPLKIGEYPSHLWVQPFMRNDTTYLAAFYGYNGTGEDTSALIIVDNTGQIVKEKKLDNSDYFENRMSGAFSEPAEEIYLVHTVTGRIRIFNNELDQIEELWIPENSVNPMISVMDLDSERNTVLYLFISNPKLVVTSSDFRNFTSYNFPAGQEVRSISRLNQKDLQNLVYFQFDNYGHIVQIQKNPYYVLEIPALVLGWMVISLAIFGIFRIQKYRDNRIREQEKRMCTLQMRAIKNQLDPHFTFNIINAMGGLYLSETNKETAYQIFIKYAQLLRQTLMSSQKISIGLKEELAMVESYLDIEKLRKDYSFDYRLTMDEKVDINTRIPRMLLYTFVENAIKHGIRSIHHEKAFLHIDIEREKQGLKLVITNSGNGLITDPYKEDSSGMGLTILEEMAELYEKLEGGKISFVMDDLIDEKGKISGVKAEVFLRK